MSLVHFFCNFLKQEYHAAGIAHCCLKLSFFFDSCWPQLSSLRFLIFDSFKTTALVPIILIEQTSCAIKKPRWQFQLALLQCSKGCRFPFNSYCQAQPQSQLQLGYSWFYCYLFLINQLCNKKPWWQSNFALLQSSNGCRFPLQFQFILPIFPDQLCIQKALLTSLICSINEKFPYSRIISILTFDMRIGNLVLF